MTGRDKLDCVPLFLGELADDIFVCGKTINLLKLCCPEVQSYSNTLTFGMSKSLFIITFLQF